MSYLPALQYHIVIYNFCLHPEQRDASPPVNSQTSVSLVGPLNEHTHNRKPHVNFLEAQEEEIDPKQTRPEAKKKPPPFPHAFPVNQLQPPLQPQPQPRWTQPKVQSKNIAKHLDNSSQSNPQLQHWSKWKSPENGGNFLPQPQMYPGCMPNMINPAERSYIGHRKSGSDSNRASLQDSWGQSLQNVSSGSSNLIRKQLRESMAPEISTASEDNLDRIFGSLEPTSIMQYANTYNTHNNPDMQSFHSTQSFGPFCSSINNSTRTENKNRRAQETNHDAVESSAALPSKSIISPDYEKNICCATDSIHLDNHVNVDSANHTVARPKPRSYDDAVDIRDIRALISKDPRELTHCTDGYSTPPLSDPDQRDSNFTIHVPLKIENEYNPTRKV